MLRTEKIEISKDEPLNPGDRIDMHFLTTDMFWITAAQIVLIESRLESREDFRILSWSLPEYNKVIFKVEVLKTNPVILTAAVIGAGIIGAGIITWLVLDKVYKIVESPAGTIALAGTGSLGIAALVIAVLLLLRHFRE